ncbi:MAG: 1-acyl-sn-glycerol-3-phosphate acyltransferase [Candidatus Izemoplasmatales bacterium]|nr:1-acyl-sn-glycerol-3-phosphate acyltransferase [Candidatus Izemoplasmatales bacterium]
MQKTKRDRQQDFWLQTLRPLVYIWMRIDAKRKVNCDPLIDFKRKEPYVMLVNHTFMFDVVHVPLRFKNVPFIIASQTLFTRQPAKFFVTQIAHVIPKSKGKSDIQTIRSIFNAVKKGYPILIFPEGDTTFYGETGYIEESTMKLIKKLGIDVLTCNVKGGYLSKPRWATSKRKNRRIELNYKLEIPKEKLKDLTVEEISDIIHKALYHNDYEYQRQMMIPHPGKRLAEGLENIVYICPHCESVNTIETNKNVIRCTACKKEGYIDKFGFINNFVFDNLLDWNKFQRRFSDKLYQSTIESKGFLSFLNMEDESQVLIGEVDLLYRDENFYLSGAHEEEIPIVDIENPTVTLRRDLGFKFKEKHYIIRLEHYSAAFLRLLQEKY